MYRVLTVVAMGGLVAAGACYDSPPPEVRAGASSPEDASATTAQRGNPEVSRRDEAGEQPPQATSTDQPETTRGPSGGTPPTGAPPITTPLTTPPASPSDSGVQGRVMMWPSCPVESGDLSCTPRPLAARVVVSRRSGERIAIADARGDGWFEVAVSPGDYVVEGQADGVMCAPVDVTVTSNRYVLVEISCDTGIR